MEMEKRVVVGFTMSLMGTDGVECFSGVEVLFSNMRRLVAKFIM